MSMMISRLLRRPAGLLALSGLGLLPAMAMGQGIEGVLERGSTHSALFVVSPESGDLVGYAFRNGSPVGKTILESCMTEMLCRIDQSSEREMRNPPVQQFKDQPSGWLELTRVRGVEMTSESMRLEAVDTRFGKVAGNEELQLLFRGKPIPNVTGQFSIARQYEVGAADVLLLQNSGGTACPARYRFATVTARGIALTPEFGSCSDLIASYQEGNRIRLLMPKLISGSMSNMANEGQQRVWAKATYVFAQGQVVEQK